MTKYTNLKSLNVFHREHITKIVFFVLFAALAGGIALAYPFAASRIIIHLNDGAYWEMAKFAFILFGLVVAGAGFELVCDYLYNKTTNALYFNIRRGVVSRTMSMNLSAVYDKGSGFFLERMGEDAREASVVFLNIARAIVNLLINLSFIGYITVLNPYLGLLFVAGLAVIVVLEYVRVSRLLINKKKSKRAVERVKANEAEILKGIKEIKGLNAREALLEKHSEASDSFVDIKYKREMFEKKMQRGIDFTKAVVDLAILLFAGLYLLPRNAVELAAVLVVYSYKGNIYELIAGLARIKDHYVNGELAAKRLNDIIAAPPKETDSFGAEPVGTEIGTITFEDVFFGYSPDKPILNGVSFNVKCPGVVGFVGKSGSGKSTIFSLLAGFYKPSGGKIFIDGVDFETLSEDAVRKAVTPILQDPYIFNDTVYNNIKFARPDATKDEIETACRSARIHDEIMAMRDGYGTVIGENGATISGGQKQRLEIARALLKDAKVMLFDEATSALDKDNLNKINDLIAELGKTKIVLVIAHRLGVMRRVDEVIVLDGGKIIAEGHHDELLKLSEYYAELFKKSAAEPEVQKSN